jgi:cytochrome P450
MFSLQNTEREWSKPREFIPERWIDEELASSEQPKKSKHPKCPFSSFFSSSPSTGSSSVDFYSGVGFTEGALSFFPFSAGDRLCLGKELALQVLRSVLAQVTPQFRLIPFESSWEEDVGQSVNATILPLMAGSTLFKVKRVVEVIKEGQREVEEEDEGWADDE